MLCRVRFRKSPLVFVVLACALNVNAQTPESTPKQVAIHELLRLLRATEFSKTILVTLIDQYSRALAQNTIDQFEKKPGSPQAKAKMKELTQEFYGRLSKRLQDEVPTRIRYDELLTGLYVEAYDQSFSEPEINELIAFYKTPTGTKFLGFAGKISASLQQKFADRAGEQVLTSTREIVDEEIERLSTKAYAAPELKAPPRRRKN